MHAISSQGKKDYKLTIQIHHKQFKRNIYRQDADTIIMEWSKGNEIR